MEANKEAQRQLPRAHPSPILNLPPEELKSLLEKVFPLLKNKNTGLQSRGNFGRKIIVIIGESEKLAPEERRMKKTICLLLLVAFAAGCNMTGFGKGVRGSGNRQTEKRNVSGFLAVEVSGAFEVEIVAQKERSLEIIGDDNILPLVTTEVRGNVLRIGSNNSYSVNRPITVKITVPDLEGISTSGASKINISGLKNSEFEVDSSGASTLSLMGETKTLKIGTSGASNIEAKDLHAQKVDVQSSGAGYVSVYATEQLNASASGAARVDYYGNPTSVSPEVSGAGSVNKK